MPASKRRKTEGHPGTSADDAQAAQEPETPLETAPLPATLQLAIIEAPLDVKLELVAETLRNAWESWELARKELMWMMEDTTRTRAASSGKLVQHQDRMLGLIKDEIWRLVPNRHTRESLLFAIEITIKAHCRVVGLHLLGEWRMGPPSP